MPRPPPHLAIPRPPPNLPLAQLPTHEQRRLAQKERLEVEKKKIETTLDAKLAKDTVLNPRVEPSHQTVQLAEFYPDADHAQSIEGEHEGEMSPKSYEYHWQLLVAYAQWVWDESHTFVGPHDGAARVYSKLVYGESGTPTASPHEASDSRAATPPPSSVPLGTPSPSKTSSSKDLTTIPPQPHCLPRSEAPYSPRSWSNFFDSLNVKSRESDAASSEASWGWTTVEGEWQSGARER